MLSPEGHLVDVSWTPRGRVIGVHAVACGGGRRRRTRRSRALARGRLNRRAAGERRAGGASPILARLLPLTRLLLAPLLAYRGRVRQAEAVASRHSTLCRRRLYKRRLCRRRLHLLLALHVLLALLLPLRVAPRRRRATARSLPILLLALLLQEIRQAACDRRAGHRLGGRDLAAHLGGVCGSRGVREGIPLCLGGGLRHRHRRRPRGDGWLADSLLLLRRLHVGVGLEDGAVEAGEVLHLAAYPCRQLGLLLLDLRRRDRPGARGLLCPLSCLLRLQSGRRDILFGRGGPGRLDVRLPPLASLEGPLKQARVPNVVHGGLDARRAAGTADAEFSHIHGKRI